MFFMVKLQYNVHLLMMYAFLAADILGVPYNFGWIQCTHLVYKSDQTYGNVRLMSMITSDTVYFFIAVHVVQHVVVYTCQPVRMYSTCMNNIRVRGCACSHGMSAMYSVRSIAFQHATRPFF